MNLKIFTSLFVLISFVKGQSLIASLQTSYCDLISQTTPELVMQINSDTSRDRSTETILRTQNFEVNNNTVSLAYIQSFGNLMIQETGQNLVSNLYSQQAANHLVFIDSRDQYIIALEVIDGPGGLYQYALFKANLGLSSIMTKFSISYTTAGSVDISQLKIKKIVQISGNYMYVMMQGSSRTSIFKIDLVTPGDLTIVGDLTTTASLNIIGGNYHHLYDQNSMRFFQLYGSQGSYIYAPTMLSELNIDSIMDLDTLKFTDLSGLVIMSCTLKNQTMLFPIGASNITNSGVIKLSGSVPPTFFTDKWKNFIAVTDQDVVWIRTTTSGIIYNQLSLVLSGTQRDTIQATFFNAEYVSFDAGYALVISKNIGNNLGSLTTILYNPSTSPYFTVGDRLQNAVTLDSGNFTQLQNPTTNSRYYTTYKCNCVSLIIERMECYSSALKCLTITSSRRTDCTKTA